MKRNFILIFGALAFLTGCAWFPTTTAPDGASVGSRLDAFDAAFQEGGKMTLDGSVTLAVAASEGLPQTTTKAFSVRVDVNRHYFYEMMATDGTEQGRVVEDINGHMSLRTISGTLIWSEMLSEAFDEALFAAQVGSVFDLVMPFPADAEYSIGEDGVITVLFLLAPTFADPEYAGQLAWLGLAGLTIPEEIQATMKLTFSEDGKTLLLDFSVPSFVNPDDAGETIAISFQATLAQPESVSKAGFSQGTYTLCAPSDKELTTNTYKGGLYDVGVYCRTEADNWIKYSLEPGYYYFHDAEHKATAFSLTDALGNEQFPDPFFAVETAGIYFLKVSPEDTGQYAIKSLLIPLAGFDTVSGRFPAGPVITGEIVLNDPSTRYFLLSTDAMEGYLKIEGETADSPDLLIVCEEWEASLSALGTGLIPIQAGAAVIIGVSGTKAGNYSFAWQFVLNVATSTEYALMPELGLGETDQIVSLSETFPAQNYRFTIAIEGNYRFLLQGGNSETLDLAAQYTIYTAEGVLVGVPDADDGLILGAGAYYAVIGFDQEGSFLAIPVIIPGS